MIESITSILAQVLGEKALERVIELADKPNFKLSITVDQFAFTEPGDHQALLVLLTTTNLNADPYSIMGFNLLINDKVIKNHPIQQREPTVYNHVWIFDKLTSNLLSFTGHWPYESLTTFYLRQNESIQGLIFFDLKSVTQSVRSLGIEAVIGGYAHRPKADLI